MTQMQTQVLARARCLRVAFLVEVAEASHPILDAIFQYSYLLWGGRFSLIVPCTAGEPLPEYLPWLKAYDPDLIYSYIDLAQDRQLEIHEDFYPSALQRHYVGRDEQHVSYTPQLAITPLSVATLLPLAGAPGMFDGTRGVQVIDAMGRHEQDRFLTDSFGLGVGLRNTIRGTLAYSASMLLAIADDEYQPRERYVIAADETVNDVHVMMRAMAKNGRIRGVGQLSALCAPRLTLDSHRWARSFNIVVGNTVNDRILFWNARALMPQWWDGNDVDLCVPWAKFDDPAFVDALREFLNRRNLVGGNGSGPHGATLRSVSMSANDLGQIAQRLREGRTWIMFDVEHVSSVAGCVPDAESLERQMFSLGQRGFRSPRAWLESYSLGDEIRPSVPEPEHLRHAPPSLVDQSAGAWAVDLDIERSLDHSPYSNVRHRWRLPRRLRATRAFLSCYQLTYPSGELFAPRVSTGGLLTAFATANIDLPKIVVPTDHDAIVGALEHGRDWLPFERIRNREEPLQLCCEARRSSAGRYFWGVYQLFGDMNTARSVLLHEFWRKQLEDWGATDQRTDVRQDNMRAKLLNRIGQRQLNLGNDDQLYALSDIVLQEADSVRMTIRSLDWAKFDADLKSISRRYDANYPPPQGHPYDEQEELRQRITNLRQSVQNLCSLGVLHQGYEHKCRKCLHRSWVAVADLKAEIACEICHDFQPAPVDKAWQFRLNGFLREALQRYGIGPLFWVLSRVRQHNTSSFWFEGPLDVFFDRAAADANQPETDIDLTIIDDGIVRMCEVKQSERQFKNPAGLATTMAKLRPDIAMIAVMEPPSQALQRKFEEFSYALAGTGIKPELLTLNEANDIASDPHL